VGIMIDGLVIIDELSLETILEKIYLEAYSFEDLREYVYSALKKVVSLDDFLDILYSSIQNYSLVILFEWGDSFIINYRE